MDSFRQFEHQGWQRAAKLYGSAWGALTTQAAAPLLDAVHARPGVRLLDVACGPGYVTAKAVERGVEAIGVDFTPEMIALARDRYPTLHFEQGDAERLSFSDGEFDAVVMNFGMLHLGRPEDAIGEAFRVLKPGGRYAFTVWDLPQKAVAFDIVLTAIQKHGDINAPLPPGPPFFRFSDPQEARRTLMEAGFSEVKTVQAPQTWVLESGDALYTTMRTASVRTAALLNFQTPQALEAIRKQIASEAEKHRTANGVQFPMPAILTSAIR